MSEEERRGMTWDQLTDLGAWQYIMFADEQREREALERYRVLMWRRSLEVQG